MAGINQLAYDNDKSCYQLCLDLWKSGCFKFETVTLKSGNLSPIYIDLRVLVSYPKVVRSISELFLNHPMKEIRYDVICGVPFTAIPFATGISILSNIPMLMKRNETKNHGTKNMIEGTYTAGQRVLIVEDIISSGGSILETVINLREIGLIVEDAVVVLDRQQGGVEQLNKLGIRVHSLINISKLLEVLVEENYLASEKSGKILRWIHSTKVKIQDSIIQNYSNLNSNTNGLKVQKALSYAERAELTNNNISKTLFKLMETKESNLCVAIDENSAEIILDIVDQVGPNAVMIKLHCDIIDDFNQTFLIKLEKLAIRHQFLVFEDRKFADIGNTVKEQFSRGLHKISEWADLINCHVISGEGIIESLKSSANLEKTACLIVAQLSSKGNLITNSYTGVAMKFAENHSDFVIGFISQSKVSNDQKFIHLTPGVHIEASKDNLDQKYCTPDQAIKEKGADIIIVGRGICKSKNRAKTSAIYREQAYKAYLELIGYQN